METSPPLGLADRPLHLGPGATALPQPPYTGDMAWYEAYGQRHGAEGPDGRLVALHTFTAPWESWEMHPLGEEVVVCASGRMTLVQELPGGEARVELGPGQYAINPRGVWHTADVHGEATALFITAGLGTEHRPR